MARFSSPTEKIRRGGGPKSNSSPICSTEPWYRDLLDRQVGASLRCYASDFEYYQVVA
jgi:hypothetical protein